MKSGMVGILAFFAILGCSGSEFQCNSEKQEVASKQEKICVLAIGKLDSTLLEELTADLEKIFERKVELSQSALDLEFAYSPKRKHIHRLFWKNSPKYALKRVIELSASWMSTFMSLISISSSGKQMW